MDKECKDAGRGLVPIAIGTQASLSRDQIDKIFSAVSSLSENFCFLWHLPLRIMEEDRPQGLKRLKHVLPVDWMPQNDVLGQKGVVC